MKKYTKLVVVLSLLCAGGAIIAWVLSNRSAVQGASASMRNEKFPHPFAKVNEKAKAAKNNDMAIADLTNEILNLLIPSDVPPFVRGKIKERLTRAEKKYRQGKANGINESSAVNMINNLADKLATPEYTRTDRLQVRIIRVGIMASLPDLVAAKTSNLDFQKLEPLALMSPLEAMTVSLHLLQQKMVTEEWQVSPQEFAAYVHQKQTERWESQRRQKEGNTQQINSEQNVKPKLRSGATDKQREVTHSIKRAAATTNPKDLIGLADASLDILGIER